MNQVKSSITINKPIGEVFKYAASPLNGPAFIPNLNENTNIFPEEVGVGQKFDWRFNMVGVDLRGKAEISEYNSPSLVKISSTGDADSVWIYTFEKDGDGTKVTMQIDYEFSETAVQRLASMAVVDKLAQKTVEQMLENLKLILED